MCNLFLINGHDLNWWHTLISWSVITVSMGSTNKNLTDQNIDKPSFDLQQSRTVTDWWSVSRHRSLSMDSVDCTICWQISDKVDDWKVRYVNVCCGSWQLLCFGMFVRKTKINMVNQEFQIEDRLSLPLWRRENPHNTAIFTQLSYLPSIQILLLSHCRKIWVKI